MPKDGLKIDIDPSLFDARSFKLLRLMGADQPKFLRHQAALYCRDLSYFTPPYEKGGRGSTVKRTFGTNKDKKQGERSTAADIRKAMRPVAPPSKWEDKSIKKAVRKKNTATLEHIFKHSKSEYKGYKVKQFNRSQHKGVRDRRGRVQRDQKLLVFTKRDVDRHIKQKQKNVGRAKASSAELAVKLGIGKKPAKWITRHFGKVKNSLRTKRGPKGFIEIGIYEPGVGHLKSRLTFLARVRAKAMAKQVRILYRANKKKAGFK
jgi:hypothetical protein